MALVGYARCSTTTQELERQLAGLKAALVDQLFSEHVSGAAPFSERVELQRAIDACRPGDVLLVPKLDRLGRTMEDCVTRVAELLDRDVHVRTLDGRVDTKGLGTMAKPVVGVLAAAVQVERELTIERAREGIQGARNKGVPFGPKRKYTNEQAEHVRELRGQGKSYGAISKATGLTVSTVRRILGVV
ncbi:MAG: recombinase [Rhodopirellula sp.]|nr:recombinase [Rhodopirellula sp.]